MIWKSFSRKGAVRRAVGQGLFALALGVAGPGAVPVRAQGSQALPALGDASSDDLSIVAERQLGDRIMREARRDPELLDDPLLLEYVQGIWEALVDAARRRGDISDETRGQFAWEVFLVRDRTVNAFAWPGGYVGVNLGLIAITSTRDELASVLAHELSHVTQRHIARSMRGEKRASAIGMVSMLLGIMAASRSPDMANALITGGQAVSVQGQLNFSREMEREADRVGFGVLSSAGFAPAGMAGMFEKMQQAMRLSDYNQFPYLRTHPLTTERIGEARARLGVAGVAPVEAPDPDARLLHAALQGRARALMDPRGETQQRLVQGIAGADAAGSAAGLDATADALAQAYAGAVAAPRQGQWAAADAGIARASALAAGHAAALRAVKLLQAESLIDRGQAAQAVPLLEGAGGGSRVGLLLTARAALVPGAPAATERHSQEALQTWVTLHPADADAWSLLGRLYEHADQTLPAVRAQAEAQLALGDVNGAAERLRAGQRMARRTAAQADSIEAAIIDARLKDVELLRKRLRAEERESSRN